MRLLGIWPEPHVSLNDLRRSHLRFLILACWLSLYLALPELANLVQVWGNITLMVEYLASTNYTLLALVKLIFMWYHGKTLRKLLASVLDDWMTTKNDSERNTMLKIAKHGRSLTFKCIMSCTAGGLSYIFFNCRKFYRNWQQPPHQRKLIYSFILPYNYEISPNYEITFFIQLITGLSGSITNTCVDSFLSIFVLHMCSQLMNLRISLNNLVEEMAGGTISSSKYKEDLRTIIMRHEELTGNMKTINNCFSVMLFIHMISATFQLCFLTFRVYTRIRYTDFDMSIFYTGYLTFYATIIVTHLYAYCSSAERLVTESTSMMYSVFESKWYEIPSRSAKDLMLIVHRSSIPLRLNAGRFADFSIELFGIILKTSMGYVSALLTMKGG